MSGRPSSICQPISGREQKFRNPLRRWEVQFLPNGQSVGGEIIGFLDGFDGRAVRFSNARERIAGFDKINRRAGDVGKVDRRDGLFWNRDNRTRLHGESGLGNGRLSGLRGRWVGNLCRGFDSLAGLERLVIGLGFFANTTFNQETDDDGYADNDSGDDGLFKSFPAALLNIQLKAGRNLKRVLRIHTLCVSSYKHSQCQENGNLFPQARRCERGVYDLLQDSLSNFRDGL